MWPRMWWPDHNCDPPDVPLQGSGCSRGSRASPSSLLRVGRESIATVLNYTPGSQTSTDLQCGLIPKSVRPSRSASSTAFSEGCTPNRRPSSDENVRRRPFRVEGRALVGPSQGLPCTVFLVSLLLIVAAEIAAFVLVAEQVGFLWALLLLILVSALGPFVVRRVGSGVLADTRERLALGEVPTRELLDGLVVLIGGVMVCVPGFIGDGVGLLLMIGPVRHLVIRAFGHQLARRVQKTAPGRWGFIDARSTPVRRDRTARRVVPLPPGNSHGPVRPGGPAED